MVRRRPEDLFLVGSALMTALVPLAFFGDTRFKVPVIPLLIIAAATLLRERQETVGGVAAPAGGGPEASEPEEVSLPAGGASPASPG